MRTKLAVGVVIGTLVAVALPAPGASAAADPHRVKHYQVLLVELGYWLPVANGIEDDDTRHAVTAIQKVAGLPRNGTLDSPTKKAIEKGVRPKARSTVTERVVEVDRSRQVVLLVKDRKVLWILDASTGKPSTATKSGHHRIYRQYDGRRPSGMWRPKYFWRTAAFHGYHSVPNYAASHGCVRVTDATMDWLWKKDALPIGMPVFIY
jgi:hypothetical protein